MNWSDIPRNPSQRVLRQFGAIGAAACFILAGSMATAGRGAATTWAWLAAGVAAGLVTMMRPGALRLVFVGWMMAAFPIGFVVGWLALAVMFFGLFTGVGVLFRMMGRDPLRRRRQSGSYWHSRDQAASPADYLRQY